MRTQSTLARLAICTVSFCGGAGILLVYRSIYTPAARASVASTSDVETASIEDERAFSEGVETASEPALVDTTIATPELTPREVVLLQLESLRAGREDVNQLRTCFSLASPSNRALTGPFERFAEMVFTPPYDVLMGDGQIQVGTAIVDEEVAAVLVTVVDTDGHPTAFRFVLVKQSMPPYEDCWLTEAVLFESIIAPLGDEALRKVEGNVGR